MVLISFAFVEEVLFLILLLPSERHGTDVNDKHGSAPIFQMTLLWQLKQKRHMCGQILKKTVSATTAMTWAKFISVDYKHFFRMFFCPKCLSAGGQIGAVLENEVTCNDKCEDILLQILFLPSPDVSDQF